MPTEYDYDRECEEIDETLEEEVDNLNKMEDKQHGNIK